MKRLIVTLLSFYQSFVSPFLHQLLGLQTACRYPQTCSEYAKESIQKHGIRRGTFLSVKRILSCQPFTNRLRSGTLRKKGISK